jgi:hypothetical protein
MIDSSKKLLTSGSTAIAAIPIRGNMTKVINVIFDSLNTACREVSNY